MKGHGMIVIGIAGGSGTGKSTIARHIAQEFQGVHIDADRVAHAVLDEDTRTVGALRAAFGDGILSADGTVSRLRLGRMVFADPAQLSRLNAIVHPAVTARCAEAVEAARTAGARVAVVDAALLFEVPMPFTFHLLIALTCDFDTRLARIMGKGGWAEQDVRARLERQRDIEKHFYKADAVVDTGRDLPSVLKDIDARVASALDAEPK
jgi:dephospho-CoA kinase